MIEQQGRVLSIETGRASIMFQPVSGCPACDAGKGCGAGVLGRLVLRKPVILELDEQPGLSPGQAVIVGIPEAWFLRLLAKLYLLPILSGLAGAALGHYLAGLLFLQGLALDLAALTGALISAAVTLHWLSRSRKGMDGEYPVLQPPIELLSYPETEGSGDLKQHCHSATR